MKSLLLRTFLLALLIGAGGGATAAEPPPLLVPAGIPNLRGLTPAEVMERLAPLEGQGTHFEVQWVLLRTSHPVYEKLHRRVIAQTADRPRRGKGYVLTLTLALFQGAAEGLGPLPVGAVPKFVGLTRERAEKVLQSLAARGARFQVRWAGKGEIIQRQSIPPGKALFPGEQALTLALSIGLHQARPGRPAYGKIVRSPGVSAPARPEKEGSERAYSPELPVAKGSSKKEAVRQRALAGAGEEARSVKRAAPPPEAPTARPSARFAMPTLGGLRRVQVEVVLRSWAEKGVHFKPSWREERLVHPSFGSFDGKVYFQSVRPGTALSPGEVSLVLHVARYIGLEPKRPTPPEPPPPGVLAGSRAERKRPTPLEPPQARGPQSRPAVRLEFFASPAAKGAIALPAAEAKPPAKTPPTKTKKLAASSPPPAGREKPGPGRAALTMPDLLNLERAEAEKRLAELVRRGVRLSVEWRDFPVKEARYRRFDGKVFYQSLPPGAPLVAPEATGPAAGESSQKLILHVLRYRPPTVPSFVGMDRLGVIRALARLRREGVRVNPNWVEAPVARSAEHGRVLSQEPKVGTPLPQGDWELTLRLGRWTPELAGRPGSPRVAPAGREGAPEAPAQRPGAPTPRPPAGARAEGKRPQGEGAAVAKTPAEPPAPPAGTAPKKPGAIGGFVPVLPNFVGMTSQEAYRLARELFRQGAPIQVRWDVTATSDRAKVGRVLRQSVPAGQGLSEPTRVVLQVANRYEPSPSTAPPSTTSTGPAAPAGKKEPAAASPERAMPNLLGLAPREAKRILAGWREKGVEFTVRWTVRPVQQPDQDLRIVEQSIAAGAAIPSDSPQVLLTVGRYRPGAKRPRVKP